VRPQRAHSQAIFTFIVIVFGLLFGFERWGLTSVCFDRVRLAALRSDISTFFHYFERIAAAAAALLLPICTCLPAGSFVRG
jgi:hypothetical protein